MATVQVVAAWWVARPAWGADGPYSRFCPMQPDRIPRCRSRIIVRVQSLTRAAPGFLGLLAPFPFRSGQTAVSTGKRSVAPGSFGILGRSPCS